MVKVSSFKSQVSSIAKLNTKVWLVLICLFFLATRLYQIDSNPPSLYWDEASIGYNAYSILHTGRDEWGKAFPIHFRAFGEFKLPVYIYSVVLTETIFDLTPIAIRLPAVLYSLGSLILIYFLVKKITESKIAGLLAAFGFSISPWVFIFTRTGYEATAGLFFFLLAVYLFLLSQQKKFYFLFAFFSLILSMYSYNSFRLLSGMTLVSALIYTLWNNHNRKTVLICLLSFLLFAISTIPIIRLLLFDGGFGRTEGFALLPNVQQVYEIGSGKPHLQIIFNRNQKNDWLGNIFKIGQNYLVHFSPQFLLLSGDSNPRNQNPGFGEIYWIDVPFIFLGIFALFKSRKLYTGLIIFLLLISPIPASLFKEAPHALRAILLGPILIILSGIGSWWLIQKYKILLFPLILIYLLFFGNYFYNFLTSYPIKSSADWQYGYFQIFEQYGNQFKDFDNIIISDDYAQPYIFTLVYLKIDPNIFQKTAVRNSPSDWGFSTVSNFDNSADPFFDNKFYYVKENNPDLNHSGKSLIFMTKPLGNKLPQKQINFLSGQPALFVYTMEQ